MSLIVRLRLPTEAWVQNLWPYLRTPPSLSREWWQSNKDKARASTSQACQASKKTLPLNKTAASTTRSKWWFSTRWTLSTMHSQMYTLTRLRPRTRFLILLVFHRASLQRCWAQSRCSVPEVISNKALKQLSHQSDQPWWTRKNKKPERQVAPRSSTLSILRILTRSSNNKLWTKRHRIKTLLLKHRG